MVLDVGSADGVRPSTGREATAACARDEGWQGEGKCATSCG